MEAGVVAARFLPGALSQFLRAVTFGSSAGVTCLLLLEPPFPRGLGGPHWGAGGLPFVTTLLLPRTLLLSLSGVSWFQTISPAPQSRRKLPVVVWPFAIFKQNMLFLTEQ